MPQWNAKPSAGAQAEVDALEAVVATLATTVSTNTSAIATKASTSDLTTGLAGKAALVHGSQHDTAGVDPIARSSMERFSMATVYGLANFPRHECVSVAVSAGRGIGGLCVADAAGTYSKLSLFQGTVMTGATFLSFVVWDENGNPIARTTDLSGVQAAGTLYETPLLDLVTLLPITVSVTKGSRRYFGLVNNATTAGTWAGKSLFNAFLGSITGVTPMVMIATVATPTIPSIIASTSGVSIQLLWGALRP